MTWSYLALDTPMQALYAIVGAWQFIISSVEHVPKANSKKRRASWSIPTIPTNVGVLHILQKVICHIMV